MTQKQTASQPVRAAALICEYNPFHNGHAAQLAMLRRAYPDAAILCIQSGSFVQRGDAAIFPAPLRAHAALLHGADAVFSLPAAYSLASAERFACAGVESAAHLGAGVQQLPLDLQKGLDLQNRTDSSLQIGKPTGPFEIAQVADGEDLGNAVAQGAQNLIGLVDR